jgi:hypothetical protein
MDFYLSRSSKMYGGAYSLTSYLPSAPPPSEVLLTWWYWGNENDLHVNLSATDGQKLEVKLGKKLDFGEAVNLTTGEIHKVETAPRLNA